MMKNSMKCLGKEILYESSNEVAELVERLRRGDMDARNRLIEAHIWLAVYLAQKYLSVDNSIEDLISVAYVGLVKAMNTYKPDKNVKPSTYASHCIQNELRMYYNRNKKNKMETYLEEEQTDGNKTRKIEDLLGTETEIVISEVIENELIAEINNVIEKWPKREREIVEMRLGLNGNREESQKTVAGKLGITQSCVSKIEKKAMNKIRLSFEKHTD